MLGGRGLTVSVSGAGLGALQDYTLSAEQAEQLRGKMLRELPSGRWGSEDIAIGDVPTGEIVLPPAAGSCRVYAFDNMFAPATLDVGRLDARAHSPGLTAMLRSWYPAKSPPSAIQVLATGKLTVRGISTRTHCADRPRRSNG